jgi:hypothetical protein
MLPRSVVFRQDEDRSAQGRADGECQNEGADEHGRCRASRMRDQGCNIGGIDEDQHQREAKTHRRAHGRVTDLYSPDGLANSGCFLFCIRELRWPIATETPQPMPGSLASG